MFFIQFICLAVGFSPLAFFVLILFFHFGVVIVGKSKTMNFVRYGANEKSYLTQIYRSSRVLQIHLSCEKHLNQSMGFFPVSFGFVHILMIYTWNLTQVFAGGNTADIFAQ